MIPSLKTEICTSLLHQTAVQNAGTVYLPFLLFFLLLSFLNEAHLCVYQKRKKYLANQIDKYKKKLREEKYFLKENSD